MAYILRTTCLALTLAAVTTAPARADDPLEALREGLAQAAPSMAARIRAHAVPPLDPADVTSRRFTGVLHPDSGRPVCDPEIVGVVAIDQAVRFLMARVLGDIGMRAESAQLAAVAPLHDGDQAMHAGEAVIALATVVRAGAPRDTGRPLSVAVRGLGFSMLNLGRERAAPESSVIRMIVQAAQTAVVVDPEGGPALVAEYADRVFRVLVPSDARAAARCRS